MAIRILAADAQELFRHGLCAVLEVQPGWNVVETSEAQEAIKLAKQVQPDVAVLDAHLPALGGPKTAWRIRQIVPHAEILLLCGNESEETLIRAMEAGIRGYISRTTASREIVTAVSSLVQHRTYLTSEMCEFLLDEYLRMKNLAPKKALTAFERQVLRLVTQGRSAEDIAALTGTTRRTVETQRARLMRKFNVSSVAELMRYALQHQLLEA